MFDICLLDDAAHARDLAVPSQNDLAERFLILGSPQVVWLGQTLRDVARNSSGTDGEPWRTQANHFAPDLPGTRRIPVSVLFGELDAAAIGFEPIVSRVGSVENSMATAGHTLHQVLKELPNCALAGLLDKLGYSELADAVDGDEKKELAFGICASAVTMWRETLNCLGPGEWVKQ